MARRVVVTGIGIISSIGKSPEENLRNLCSKISGISTLELVTTRHRGSLKVGEIKSTTEDLQSVLQIPDTSRMTRTSILGTFAVQQAIEHAGIDDVNSEKTGLISSTSVGGMDFTDQHYRQYDAHPELKFYINSHHAGFSTNAISEHIGLKGFTTTISTACSSSANAISLGTDMIVRGDLERAIVGGTDALSKFTINGFNTLMILSDDFNTPFDEHRKGLNLGEAAAYLVLETEQSALEKGKNILAYLSGYANANDAFHQTASSENGDGAYLAMQGALEKAKINAGDIDYINAHGTATPNNDLSEGRALLRTFERVPDFSSTKSFTGHTLAAAAAVEAVYSILAIQNNVVLPTLNFKSPMKEFDLTPVTDTIHKPIHHVLSNSFGFGGNCSTLIFSKA